MVQEYGRYFGMKTGVLSRRLPDRSRPRRRGTARVSVVSDEMRRRRPALPGVRLQGQAGAGQHPQPTTSCPRSGISFQSSAGWRSLQHRRITFFQHCSMLEAIALCEEIHRAADCSWTYGSEPHRRPHLVDQRHPGSSIHTTRAGGINTIWTASPTRSTRAF